MTLQEKIDSVVKKLEDAKYKGNGSDSLGDWTIDFAIGRVQDVETAGELRHVSLGLMDDALEAMKEALDDTVETLNEAINDGDKQV